MFLIETKIGKTKNVKGKKNRHTASLATMIGNTRDLHPNISICFNP